MRTERGAGRRGSRYRAAATNRLSGCQTGGCETEAPGSMTPTGNSGGIRGAVRANRVRIGCTRTTLTDLHSFGDRPAIYYRKPEGDYFNPESNKINALCAVVSIPDFLCLPEIENAAPHSLLASWLRRTAPARTTNAAQTTAGHVPQPKKAGRAWSHRPCPRNILVPNLPRRAPDESRCSSFVLLSQRTQEL